jgi:SAM-dependent methyltransferase
MGVRDRLQSGLARQLGHPHGLMGRLVGSRLNWANQANLTAAVEALTVAPGETALDVGFGGGLSLRLLLDRVGPNGRVYGVEVSRAMLRLASRRYRDAIAAGRLVPLEAPMTDLSLTDHTVDAAMTVNTVYFVPDLDAALAELARVLAPAGRLVVGLGHPDAMAGDPVVRHGFRVRPLTEVEASLRAAGFALVADHRVGSGPEAFHLLVAAKPAAS